MIYLILTALAAVAHGCPDLPSVVEDCGKYKINKGNSRECIGKGAGCVEGGWFSKDNTSNPNQRIDAQQVCKSQGYTGVESGKFGGNWGHQCRVPGNKINELNKAGGQLTALGYTVTWKCAGNGGCDPTAPPTQPPGNNCNVLANNVKNQVVDCGKYSGNKECTGKGAGCAGAGWYSKDNTSNPNQRVNAQDICKQQGYTQGVDTQRFGGNWGHQCRIPGNSANSTNKAGGEVTNLGYTVSWKCKGNRQCTPTAPPTVPPTNPPTAPPTNPVVKCKDATTVDECNAGFCQAKTKKGKLKKCKQKKCKKEFKKDMKKDPPVRENCEASQFCMIKVKPSKNDKKPDKVSCVEFKEE